MKDFPSCFGENGIQVADFSSSSTNRATQNFVTCVYQCRLRGHSCLITVTWSKNLMGRGLSVGIDDNSNQSLCKFDIKPWLFSKKKGSKSVEADSTNIDLYWDLSSAKFGSGPEPLEGFYLGVVFNRQMILLLGDMRKEAFKKTSATPVPSNAVFIAKRENLYDSKTVMQVKQLQWKFRGNNTILVDGLAVEVFWDVHSWLFGASLGNAVFMFNTSLSAEKLWAGQPLSDTQSLPWSWSQRFRYSQSQCLGFSLILYAWKNE